MKRAMRWRAFVDAQALLLGLGLGSLFFYSGLVKRLDPFGFADAVLAYELLPLPVVGLVAAILPWVELASGFFLTLGYVAELFGRLLQKLGVAAGGRLRGGIKRRSCLLILAWVTALFLVILVITMARGLKIECGCGLLGERMVGWEALGEDLFFLTVAVFLYWWELPGADQPLGTGSGT